MGASQNVLVLYKTTKEVSDLSFANWGKHRPLEEAVGGLEGLSLGSNSGAVDIQLAPSFAAGVWSASTASGVVGVSIGGRAVTVTASGGDAATADALAAAINADATAKTYCRALSRTATGTLTIASGSGVITATFNIPGPSGSAYWQVVVSVTWATSDTATAAALVAAVNATANLPFIATSSAGVVTFYFNPQGGSLDSPASGASNTAGNGVALIGSGTGVTVSSPANGGTNANVLVQALVPGTMGNGLALATSGAGTGQSVATGANLIGGLGGPGNLFTA